MSVQIVECPRDAMQGFHRLITTDEKIEYLNILSKVGFSMLDCGSFVSPKAVPQLADTHEVLSQIDPITNGTELLVIVANERGAEQAADINKVDYMGFPFSISEVFQKRNTNQGLKEALIRLKNIQKIANDANKKLLVYLSMGFGNPYNEAWSVEIALKWCKVLSDNGINTINLSDTIGVANKNSINDMFKQCLLNLPHISFGAHLHTKMDNYLENISSAFDAGCNRFDSAIKGFGGCPFANDSMIGNLPTELLLDYLNHHKIDNSIDKIQFDLAYQKASVLFV
ncbi:MAG: hydroxymethylglutaryl-CoA lyase [Bacteroidota bacterium]|nr:hydroxymethylglutaryl-CoA lyase [Bacteroidota bacterium]